MIGLLTHGQRVTVRAVAPEGGTSWAFAAEALTDDGDEIIVRVEEGAPIAGPEPWHWPAVGEFHLWRSRPYGVLVTTRARRFPYWYCPIHTPAVPDGDEIRVTDLGLDVQLFADGRYSVGGEAPDPARFPDLAGLAATAAADVVALLTRRAPPFGRRNMPDAREA